METPRINSVEELQIAKEQLRQQIKLKEVDLKEHYKIISQQVAPALKIANFVSGNKLFKSALGSENEKGKGWMSSAIKLLTIASAGGFILNRSKRNFGKAIMAYALDQGIQYIRDHDLSEHIEQIKRWFNIGENTSSQVGDDDTED